MLFRIFFAVKCQFNGNITGKLCIVLRMRKQSVAGLLFEAEAKNIDAFYDGRERDIPAQREKHHSYDLRYKLRAVAAAKKSINCCCARVWSRLNNERPFRISAHLV